MNFKVGMRVRIKSDLPLPARAEQRWGHLRGAETTLVARAEHMDTARWPRFWLVAVNGRFGEPIYCSELALTPITDPGAEKFIASIKNLKPYEEPTVPAPAQTTGIPAKVWP